MDIIKKISIVTVIYFLFFVQAREIITTHIGLARKCCFMAHENYNHTSTPDTYIETSDKMPENYLIKSKINSQGLREDEDVIIPKPKEIYRILLVGDSFTFGTNIQLAHILEKELNKRLDSNIKFEVVNCGTPGFSALPHLARLKHQHLSLEPDAIIYLPDLTDVFEDTHRYNFFSKFDENGKLVKVRGSNRIVRAKRRHQMLFKSLLSKFGIEDEKRDISSEDFGGPYPHTYDHSREDEESPSVFTKQEINFSLKFISEYIDIARENDIHISFVTYPHLTQIIPETLVYPGSAFNTIHNRLFEYGIKNLAKRKNVSFKSFFNMIKKEVLTGSAIKISIDNMFRFFIRSSDLVIGFKTKEDLINYKTGAVILKKGETIHSRESMMSNEIGFSELLHLLKENNNNNMVEIEPESLIGHLLIDRIPISDEQVGYESRITKHTLNLLKKQNKQKELFVLKPKKLYFNEDIHFNDQGLLFLGRGLADWVTSNPLETIGYNISN